MVFDHENMFLDGVAGTTYGTTAKYSDVIANTSGGDAINPLALVFAITEAALAGGALTVVLQTSDTEAFTVATDVATYAVATGAKGIAIGARLPYGLKKYLRLKITGAAAVTGACKITSGIVADIDLK